MEARASRIPHKIGRLFSRLSHLIGFQRKHTDVSGPGYFKTLKRLGLLTLVVCLISWLTAFNSIGGLVPKLGTVSLTWDPSLGTVAGYHLYSGTSSQTYTAITNVGNATTITVPGIVKGVTYYFAVTAYDTNGMESDFSPEISYVQASTFTLPPAGLRVTADHQIAISMTGVSGHTYDVLATTNLQAWTVIGTVTLNGPLSTFDFVDTNSASFSSRFYRFREAQ
jgi:hypothetical protein